MNQIRVPNTCVTLMIRQRRSCKPRDTGERGGERVDFDSEERRKPVAVSSNPTDLHLMMMTIIMKKKKKKKKKKENK